MGVPSINSCDLKLLFWPSCDVDAAGLRASSHIVSSEGDPDGGRGRYCDCCWSKSSSAGVSISGTRSGNLKDCIFKRSMDVIDFGDGSGEL